jgi:5-methylcytosine-specific restriction endonuclease McrA
VDTKFKKGDKPVGGIETRFKKGHSGYWKDKKLYEETKIKMSLSRKGNKGHPSTIENIERMRNLGFEHAGKNHWNYQGGISKDKERIFIMNKNRTNEWRKKNPEKYNKSNHESRVKRRARMRGAEGSHTYEDFVEKKRLLGNKCMICGKSETEVKMTIDHIIPLSKGGSNYISNIQPLCFHCNSSKNNKMLK